MLSVSAFGKSVHLPNLYIFDSLRVMPRRWNAALTIASGRRGRIQSSNRLPSVFCDVADNGVVVPSGLRLDIVDLPFEIAGHTKTNITCHQAALTPVIKAD